MAPLFDFVDPAPERVEAFILKLRESKQIKIDKATYSQLFDQCFPPRPRGSEVRHWLLKALRAAETQGVIAFPSVRGKSWELAIQPPLPTFVMRLVRVQPRPKTWQFFPWHPRLAWVATLNSLSSDQEKFLRRVNQGFIHNEFDQPAPFKYRSLTLTNDEKALGRLSKTVLFEPQRLSLKDLNCIPDIPPLASEEIGSQARAIVFENIGAYRVACTTLRMLKDDAPYGLVAFGGGGGFRRSVLAFQYIPRTFEHIAYVGDLDKPGLNIARSAALVAQEAGLPPVLPAIHVYRAMLLAAQRFGKADGWNYEKASEENISDAILGLLPEDIRPQIEAIFQARKRIPEEVLGPDDFEQLWRDMRTESLH